MRVLIVTNMYPTPERPALGSFVRDQVHALERTGEVELDVFAFDPRGYARAAAALRRRRGFDVVHAHYGLTLWPALAAGGRRRAVTLHGTDLAHPRSRKITLAGLRTQDLICAVSEPLAHKIPRWAASRERVTVIPAGVDVDRFRRIPRDEARQQLGLDRDAPYVLFPADPGRPEKRFDRAQQLANGITLLTLIDVQPQDVPLYVNAANAVLVPSEREGFGLATLEALACDVPVLATPVGIAPEVLNDLPGTFCAPFDRQTWSDALHEHLSEHDPRIAGRDRALRYSTDVMAQQLIEAWRRLL